jgi:hypothetical protein
MTRDDGWQLLSIGRQVERLGFFAESLLLAVRSGALDPEATGRAGGGSHYAALLALFDSSITFRAQHQQSRELEPLLSLIVLDPENPERWRASFTRCAPDWRSWPTRRWAPPTRSGGCCRTPGPMAPDPAVRAATRPGRCPHCCNAWRPARNRHGRSPRRPPRAISGTPSAPICRGLTPMHLQVTHVTDYRYEPAVSMAQHIAHLLPRATPAQSVDRAELRVEPSPTMLTESTDAFGNRQHFFALPGEHPRPADPGRAACARRPARSRGGGFTDARVERVREHFRYRVGSAWDPATRVLATPPRTCRCRRHLPTTPTRASPTRVRSSTRQSI